MNKDNWIIVGVTVSFLVGWITLISALYDQNPGRYYWMWSDNWFGLLRDLHAEYGSFWTLMLKMVGIFFFVCVAFFWWIPPFVPFVLLSWVIAKVINASTEAIREYRKMKAEEKKNGEDDSTSDLL